VSDQCDRHGDNAAITVAAKNADRNCNTYPQRNENPDTRTDRNANFSTTANSDADSNGNADVDSDTESNPNTHMSATRFAGSGREEDPVIYLGQ
jgi:hypothetical protein